MTTPSAAPSGGSSAPSSSSTPSGGASGGASPSTSTPPPGGAPAQSSPGSAAAPKQPATQPTRLTRKEIVNGKETVLEASEDELWSSHRKARAADQRFEEAARLRKETEAKLSQQAQLTEALKKDPRAVLSFLREQGVENPLDWVANALQAELAEEERLADPNVRARVEAERKAQELEERFKAQEFEKTQQAFDSNVEAELEKIGAVFDGAIQELGGDLAADDDTFAIMATLESENRRRGFNLSPKQLAEMTRERVVKRGVSNLLKFDDARLLAAHPELTAKFRKALVDDYNARQAAKAAPPAAAPQQTQQSSQPAAPPKRWLRTI